MQPPYTKSTFHLVHPNTILNSVNQRASLLIQNQTPYTESPSHLVPSTSNSNSSNQRASLQTKSNPYEKDFKLVNKNFRSRSNNCHDFVPNSNVEIPNPSSNLTKSKSNFSKSPSETSKKSFQTPINPNSRHSIDILLTNENTAYIKTTYQNIEFKFLIDTGANVSLIKLEKLKETQSEYNCSEILTLNGLSANAPVSTIGSIQLPLKVHELQFNIKFHIVNVETNIPFDGLIGNDFLRNENAEINYNKLQLKLNSLPCPISLHLNSNPCNSEVYFLDPRSETVIEVEILNKKIDQGICPEMQVCEGVYLAKSLVKVNNNKALTTILNTNNQKVKISHIRLVLEPFEENHSFVFNLKSNYNTETYSQDRIKLLKENLRLEHLNDEEKSSILDTCSEFNDIFCLPNDQLTCTKTIQHGISVTDPTPINSKVYRYPEVHKTEVDKQIKKMLKQGIIRPSVSPYCSPLWVVPKKLDATGERKWRIVIDYRKLNNVTVGDSYPLPNIEHILDQLGHSQYFTTLDLASGFHQIEMKPEDISKTAFSTPFGHYEFTRMPFGLRNSPSTFQRLMNTVLTGLQGLQCFVYLDDIVIYASTIDQHSEKLRSVFNRLRSNNLLLQPDKCEFMRKEVAYLGHVISSEGVAPNPEKIKAIATYPAPKNEKQIKQFLGLVGYYRRFIQNFSSIAKPLTSLLKKDTPFTWTQQTQEAFESFKTILTTQPILQYPNFKEKFLLTTDASDYAIGAVLSQGETGKDLPIAYASRTLNKAEINYSTTEKEALAIIWATNHFRPYLYGRKFTIFTDHRPLSWLFNCKNPSSRLLRWRLKLEEYEYDIRYKPGRINSNADALSRNTILVTRDQFNNTYDDFIKFHYTNSTIPSIEIIKDDIFTKFPNILFYSKDLDENNIDFESLRSVHDLGPISNKEINLHDTLSLKNNKNQTTFLSIAKLNHFDKLEYKDLFYTLQNLKQKLVKLKINKVYMKNPVKYNPNLKQEVLNKMIAFIFDKITVILINKQKIEPTDKNDIKKILEENHNSSISGHSGYIRTYKRIKENYKWPHMKNDIKKFIRSCQSCQINKSNHKVVKAPMEITTTSERPFQRLAIDIVGPITLTENGNRFIVTMQDDLTKFSYAKPVPNHEAITIANCLLEFITIFGIPESLLSDNGSDFCSEVIKELNKLFKIKHVFSSPYHPQTNGALERSHQTLKEYLKHYINQNQTNWDEYVQLAMFTYNTHIHRSTNLTPFELVFGHKAFIPKSICEKPEFRYSYDDYYSSLKSKLNKAHEIARERLVESKEKSKQYYDRNAKEISYKINDLVYILNKNIKPGLSKKLLPNYKGPYRITKVNKNKTVEVEIKTNKRATYHINLLKPFVSDDDDSSS